MNARESLRKAVELLERGEWDAAHNIAQTDESADGCWLHGIVHVIEGDLGNARYWYARAGRAFSADVPAEIAAAKVALS